jgi:hypothetical protein
LPGPSTGPVGHARLLIFTRPCGTAFMYGRLMDRPYGRINLILTAIPYHIALVNGRKKPAWSCMPRDYAI